MAEVLDLHTKFKKEIRPSLQKTLSIKNPMAVPRVEKVTINIGVGTYIKTQGKDISHIVENLALIAGQKPVLTKARKAISNFKVREQETVGIAVTLRGRRMYDFLNKLVHVVFPRVRDFRGLSPKAFDGKGNFSVGFKEHIIFPEISPDDVTKLHGLQINVITTAQNNEEGLQLLKSLGFPFKK